MSLTMSAIGLAFCITIIIVCTIIDKKSGVDNLRVLISVTGIMTMMFLFFLLANLLVLSGLWG